jgi:1,4-dihydroxy-2-naphthoate polyprenyltransferase
VAAAVLAEVKEQRMTDTITASDRSFASRLLQATRPFSFPASIVPGVVGAALAAGSSGVRWGLFPIVLAGSVIMHIGTNLVSEVFDFRKGVDRPDTYGGSRVLVEHLLSPRQVLAAGLLALAIGLTAGVVLAVLCGWPVLWLGLAGLAGGWFYSGGPFGLKYWALGDALVFVMMGPLMVLGTEFVLTGHFTVRALIASLPVGCLVAAILSGNNLRDIRHDRQARSRTLENVLGLGGAKAIYCGLVIAAHAIVVAMVAVRAASPWTLLVFLAAVPAWRNMRAVLKADLDRVAEIAAIDARTAQHHMMFGVLLAAGLVVGKVL